MKKITLTSLIFLAFIQFSFGQVGIGTATPNQSAELEIVSTNRGLLIPRIQLQSTTDNQTIATGNVESLLVYNTATQNDVTPGYYYWHNGKWRKIMNTGNSIITTLTDNTDGTFTYVNEAGDTTNFDANTLTFINNNDGSYTFVKANGDSLVVDVPGEVVNNFGDIVNNGPVLVDGNTYTTVKKYLQSIVDSSQTVTTLVDNGNGTFAYINEAGDTTSFDANTTHFVNNNDGTYTLTTDGGDSLVIDVPGSVVKNFDTIVNGGPVMVDGNTYATVKKYLNSLIDSSATVIQYDSTNNTMTVVNQAGDTTTVQFNNTQFVNHNDGTYTYINEQGDTTLVNVPGDVVKNITNKGDVYNVIDSLISSSSDTLYDNGNGTYTHIAVNGDTTVIDVPGSVVQNFDTIVNGGPVTVDGNTYTTVKKYLNSLIDSSATVIQYDSTNNTMTVVNQAGDTTTVQFNNTQFVNHNDGTYTYINEQGDTTLVNVPGDIVKNITNKGDVYNVIDSLITSSSDTLYDNGNGTYTHIAVNGDTTVIDVPGSVVQNFDTIVNGGPVTVDGNTYTTVKKYIQNLVDSSETLTTLIVQGDTALAYTDENRVLHILNLSNLVDTLETVTQMTIQGDSALAYTDENHITHVLNLKALVDSLETLTTIGFVNDSTQIDYTDENGVITHLPLKPAVDSLETLTQLTFQNDTITYVDENNISHKIGLDTLAIEPWQVYMSTNPATANTDHIYQNGKVAIGIDGTTDLSTLSTLANNAQLYVNGDVMTSGTFYTTTSTYADYVFQKYFTGHSNINKNYQFETLQQIASYLKEHHHLPGIKSINQLHKTANGYQINVTGLSVKLLEKVEELYLHTIEQQKQINQLKQQVKNMNERLSKLEQQFSKK